MSYASGKSVLSGTVLRQKVEGRRQKGVYSTQLHKITTRCGAKLGDTEARIKALYPGIEVSPHKYAYAEGWHYLTLVPKDKRYSNYRIVFETDSKHITALRSGKIPEVEYVEGG